MKKVLALDLSTSCSGWAYFEGEELIESGKIKPKVKGITKMSYPEGALRKMQDLSVKICDLIVDYKPDLIVIEEINRGINRLGQKVLDGFHFILLNHIDILNYLRKVYFMDSDSTDGWRSKNGLNLIFTSKQKAFNKAVRSDNKKIKAANRTRKRGAKLDLKKEITKKTLACLKVNELFNLELDDWKNPNDADEADAIGLGYAFILQNKV